MSPLFFQACFWENIVRLIVCLAIIALFLSAIQTHLVLTRKLRGIVANIQLARLAGGKTRWKGDFYTCLNCVTRAKFRLIPFT